MALEFRKVCPEMRRPLTAFFRHLDESGDARWFHPHHFNSLEAGTKCVYKGKDLYYAAMDGGRVLAYGMLRGWDEGWKTPSLGIAVHRDMRRKGLAEAFMRFLHAAARAKGAKKVRLKVFPENIPALKLYESLGYRFRKEMEDWQLVGFFDLKAKKKAKKWIGDEKERLEYLARKANINMGKCLSSEERDELIGLLDQDAYKFDGPEGIKKLVVYSAAAMVGLGLSKLMRGEDVR